ncbi:hypothetical protein [Microvirga pakistanensis]|uniref:hypothetical protein n=1 Tax=Microvirga pakistanensis TaxID=1682650 RepID=UPI00106C5333|nr:hypothetical protein [Microvirga pakistanensis]
MGRIPKGSFAWHDTDDSLEEHVPADPAMAGLPEHWRHYEWKLAAGALAGLWLIETLTSGVPITDMPDANHVPPGSWGLLAAATICVGLFRIGRRLQPLHPARVGFPAEPHARRDPK